MRRETGTKSIVYNLIYTEVLVALLQLCIVAVACHALRHSIHRIELLNYLISATRLCIASTSFPLNTYRIDSSLSSGQKSNLNHDQLGKVEGTSVDLQQNLLTILVLRLALIIGMITITSVFIWCYVQRRHVYRCVYFFFLVADISLSVCLSVLLIYLYIILVFFFALISIYHFQFQYCIIPIQSSYYSQRILHKILMYLVAISNTFQYFSKLSHPFFIRVLHWVCSGNVMQ